MNSIWNKNISLFKARFPQLFDILKTAIEKFDVEKPVFSKIYTAKNGSLIADDKNLRLHSAYNPEKEAEELISRLIKENNSCSFVFLGFGLGYAVKVAEKYCDANLILIEPNINYFLSALSLIDFSDVFLHKNLIILVSATFDEVMPILNNIGVKNCVFVNVASQKNHAKNYFDTLETLIKRNRKKEEINDATTKKFEKRWAMNCKKNAKIFLSSDGVNIYKNTAGDLPFLLVASGPSLKEILPYLTEIKKRAVIVCVDASLRTLLKANVEPDFIITTDPQYYAYRHTAGLSSPSSVLVTLPEVYPATLRFPCRKIVFASSHIPAGIELEKSSEASNAFSTKAVVSPRLRSGQATAWRPSFSRGDLGLGGSVASSAWNFCHLCGAKNIFTAGLDLSFPEKLSHIKGSNFEKNALIFSTKLKPLETLTMPLLFSANPTFGENYKGEKVLTDSKMKMFAWWFESRLAECPETKTFSLSAESLKVPGIELSSVEKLLEFREKK